MRLPRLSKETFSFALDSVILVNAGVISGFLFLLVHPILGRLMAPVDYAVFVQLMGLLAVLGVPSGAVQVAITRYVAEFAHGNQVDLWVTVVRRATRRLLWWTAVTLALWCALAPWMAGLLAVASPVNLIILGLAVAVSLFVPIVYGTLQGAMRFRWLAMASVGHGALRVLFCAAAAALFGGVPAALAAVGLSFLAGLALGAWPFRNVMAGTPSIPGFDTRPVYRYLWPVLAGQAAVFLLVNADLILSARLLAGDDLARYGKVAMLARTVLFVAQPIAAAMFPRAVNSTRLRVLLVPLAAAAAVTVAGAAALSLYPGLPMRLMYGVDDAAYEALTRRYAWAAVPQGLFMFLAPYLWARHQPGRVLLLWPVLGGYLLGLFAVSGSPTGMIGVMALAGSAALAVLVAALLWRPRGDAAHAA